MSKRSKGGHLVRKAPAVRLPAPAPEASTEWPRSYWSCPYSLGCTDFADHAKRHDPEVMVVDPSIRLVGLRFAAASSNLTSKGFAALLGYDVEHGGLTSALVRGALNHSERYGEPGPEAERVAMLLVLGRLEGPHLELIASAGTIGSAAAEFFAHPRVRDPFKVALIANSRRDPEVLAAARRAGHVPRAAAALTAMTFKWDPRSLLKVSRTLVSLVQGNPDEGVSVLESLAPEWDQDPMEIAAALRAFM